MNVLKATNKYKICSGYKAVHYINSCLGNRLKLSRDQELKLIHEFGDSGMNGNLDMDIQFYTWEREIPQGKNIMWRLTAPFHFIFAILITLTIFPIHWLIYGTNDFGRKNWLINTMTAWYGKIWEVNI